jgi:hypothetical protein
MAALMTAAPAPAELVIYSGTAKESRVGSGQSQNLTFKYYLVLDHDTANLTEIVYSTINGVKRFSVYNHTNYHLVEIGGPNGKNTEAIAHLPSSCDGSSGSSTESVFLAGTASSLVVSSNSTISFAKALSGAGKGVSYSSGQPAYFQTSIVIAFNSAQTLTSNQNGETLDTATTRLSNVLQGQGYYQQSEKLSERSSELPPMLP